MDDIKKILVGINWPLNDDQKDDTINRDSLRASIVSDINTNSKFQPIGIRISTSNGLQIFEKSNETLVGLGLSLPESDQNPGFNDADVDGTVDNNGQVTQRDTSGNKRISQITDVDDVDITFGSIYLTVHDLTVRNDTAGSGWFGADRGVAENGEKRKHAGIDFITKKDWTIFSPIDGTIQQSFPYKGDNDWTGLTITGTGKYLGYQVKMWYFTPIKTSGTVDEGSYLGLAAAISERYPGSPSMQDHIHLEVRKNGTLVDPLPYFV